MTETNKTASFSAECNEVISRYTYTVTHDLNAHLRHITQYGELLKAEEQDHLSTDGKMYVDKLIVSTKRLRQLINDQLSYAQVLHIGEERKEVDLGKILADVMGDLAGDIKKSRATINVIGKLPTLSAYPFCMMQLFLNLITNAIKYHGAEDPVITIECVDEKTHYLFSVHDNGIGIREEYHKVIFTALKRLHSQDKIEGSGLGLAICEKAVEAHGGRIWVESTPPEGSTFFFTIPSQDSQPV